MAASLNGIDLSVPATVNRPSASSMSASAASRMWAAILAAFSATLPAAMWAAEPPITAEREPMVPTPNATLSVSPSITLMSAGSIPSRPETICLYMVSCPWPWDLVPMRTSAVPDGLNRISQNSRPGPAACSMELAIPSPRSLPRDLASARRASNPSMSARSRSLSMLAAKSPQS